MVRRRTASPSPSAPVRSRAAPSTFSRPAPAAAAPSRPTAPAPAGAAPGYAPPAAAPQGPGLMGQMAATAGGVAIGSAVGHAVGNMFTGGSGHSQEVAPAAASPAQYQQSLQQPCEIEWKQFLECSQSQSDVSLCQSYNDLFKQCKLRSGV